MPKTRAKNDASYEGRLLLAIDALNNEKIHGIRKAARLYDVEESTVRRRLKGTTPLSEAAVERRKMTPTEELTMKNWVLDLERRGCPPRPRMLAQIANILLAARDPTQTPKKIGVNWVSTFLKRNPALKAKFARRLNQARAACEDPQIIRGFFDQLLALKLEYGIADEDIYNFDETGFSMGIAASAKVICSSDRSRKPSLVQPGNREWVTVIECVGATGKVVAPLIIFKGATNQAEWYTQPFLPPDWSITHSPNGWTSDEIGLQWLKRIFEPDTRPSTSGTHRLLILDGHSSHLTPAFDQVCKDSCIVACCLPPHSSHILQPLDVGVFSVLKRSYGAAVEGQMRVGINHIDKLGFLEMLYQVRPQSHTIQNIRSGFSHTGIVPFDPEKVLSQLEIRIRGATPATPKPSSPSSLTWSPKTPYNARELMRQAQSCKKLLNLQPRDEESPSNHAFNQLVKGALVNMHQTAILTSELHDIRQAVDRLQKRRTRRARNIPLEGVMRVARGRDLADEAEAAVNPPAQAAEPGASEPRRRAPPKCTNCWQLGHTRNRCTNPTL